MLKIHAISGFYANTYDDGAGAQEALFSAFFFCVVNVLINLFMYVCYMF